MEVTDPVEMALVKMWCKKSLGLKSHFGWTWSLHEMAESLSCQGFRTRVGEGMHESSAVPSLQGCQAWSACSVQGFLQFVFSRCWGCHLWMIFVFTCHSVEDFTMLWQVEVLQREASNNFNCVSHLLRSDGALASWCELMCNLLHCEVVSVRFQLHVWSHAWFLVFHWGVWLRGDVVLGLPLHWQEHGKGGNVQVASPIHPFWRRLLSAPWLQIIIQSSSTHESCTFSQWFLH